MSHVIRKFEWDPLESHVENYITLDSTWSSTQLHYPAVIQNYILTLNFVKEVIINIGKNTFI